MAAYRGWQIVNGDETMRAAPSDAEFEAAVASGV